MEPPLLKPDQKVFPAFKVFFKAFGSTNDFAIAIVCDTNRNENRYVFIILTPASFEEDTIYIDVRVLLGDQDKQDNDRNNPDSAGQAYDDLCRTAGLCCRR